VSRATCGRPPIPPELRRLARALAHALVVRYFAEHGEPANPATRARKLRRVAAELEAAEHAAAAAWARRPPRALPS
jgi:hypothetical protein